MSRYAPDTTPPDALKTKEEIAQWAQVSLRTVQQWMLDGCPHVKAARAVRFDVAAVYAWLQVPRDRAPKPRGLRRSA